MSNTYPTLKEVSVIVDSLNHELPEDFEYPFSCVSYTYGYQIKFEGMVLWDSENDLRGEVCLTWGAPLLDEDGCGQKEDLLKFVLREITATYHILVGLRWKFGV